MLVWAPSQQCYIFLVIFIAVKSDTILFVRLDLLLFLIIRIMEYIPPRPALPKRVGGVEKAINDYHTATVDVASLLLADYRYSMCAHLCTTVHVQ